MKSHFQPTPSGRKGTRGALAGNMPYLSERQTQAYLLARDTIRRIQRSASFFDAPSNETAPVQSNAQGQRKGH
jgi:hypothetical protein